MPFGHEHFPVNGSNVIIEREDGKVLMVKGSYKYWMLPGGGVERAELPSHAAMEEVLEETGFIIPRRSDLRLISLLTQKVVFKKVTIPTSGLVTLYTIRMEACEGSIATRPNDEILKRDFKSIDQIVSMYNRDQKSVGLGYVRMLLIFDMIRRGVVDPVYEHVLADPVPVKPTRFI